VEPRFLTVDDVLLLHEMQLRRFGGAAGVRDIGMLESAVAMPEADFAGEYLHADLFEMAAAYLFHIVMNQPFVDGNKRTGTHAALVFLRDNGYALDLTQRVTYDLVIGVCEGTVTKGALAATLRAHAVALDVQQDGA
jgi:death-on-curing protein